MNYVEPLFSYTIEFNYFINSEYLNEIQLILRIKLNLNIL